MLRKIRKYLSDQTGSGPSSVQRHDELKYKIGISAILASRQQYQNYKSIEEADLQVFSQYGEDGIIDFLTTKLNLTKPSFTEIGTEDYSESNTRFLFQRTNTKGLIIDSDPNLNEKVKNVLNNYYWKGDLSPVSSFVTRDNIKDLLSHHGEDWLNCDIFSLDIDGNDYWIMKEIINECNQKIIILEYNSYFGAEASVTTPYQDCFNRTTYHYSNLCWGASLRALASLLACNGYTFAGSNLNNSNGFWVKEDLFAKLEIEAPSLSNLSRYTKNFCRESRNKDGSLSYTPSNQRLSEIKDCLLVNLEDQEKLQKTSEIFNI